MESLPQADPIYLDYNATTPIDPRVADAMIPYLREHFGNPSSSHVLGQRTKAAVELARRQTADFLAAGPDDIIFGTSGNATPSSSGWRRICSLTSTLPCRLALPAYRNLAVPKESSLVSEIASSCS